jgi:hypothetical protein
MFLHVQAGDEEKSNSFSIPGTDIFWASVLHSPGVNGLMGFPLDLEKIGEVAKCPNILTWRKNHWRIGKLSRPLPRLIQEMGFRNSLNRRYQKKGLNSGGEK